jgi:sugar lactone lactonase YvrE
MGRMTRTVLLCIIAASCIAAAGCENPLLAVLKDKVARAAGDPDIQVSRGGVVVPSGGGSNASACQVGGSPRVVTFTVANVGKSTLTLMGSPVVAIGGADIASFTLGSLPYTSIAAGQNSPFTVEFAPDSTGDKSVSVTIQCDDPDTPAYAFTLSGKGVGAPGPDIQVQQGSANIDLTHAFSFGSVHAGEMAEITFTIWNYGTAGTTLGLSLNPIALTGADATAGRFTVVSQPDPGSLNVPEGGSTTFTLRFSPAAGATASYTALAHIANNDTDEGPDYSFTISGSGVLPDIAVRQGATDLVDGSGSYAFAPSVSADGPGEQVSSAVTFTIWNTGGWPLAVSGVSLSAGDTSEFVLNNTTASPVAVGGSTSFTIAFDPSTVGAKSATVTVSTDAPGAKNPYTFTVTGTASFAPKVYWTCRDSGAVKRANLNGSNPETLFSLPDPTGIAIDQTNNYMYITSWTANALYRAPLDGSASPSQIASGPALYGVAVDSANGKVYYTSYDAGTILRCNLDGSSPGTFGGGSGYLFGVAVDGSNGVLYWSNWSAGRVYRSSTSSFSASIFISGGGNTSGMAIDTTNNYLYWAEQGMGMLCRADIAAPGRQIIGSTPYPDSVAVDPGHGWVFWGNHGGQLYRANLDGSNAAVVGSAGGRIYGIALDLVQ